jgi:hypothetical protein
VRSRTAILAIVIDGNKDQSRLFLYCCKDLTLIRAQTLPVNLLSLSVVKVEDAIYRATFTAKQPEPQSQAIAGQQPLPFDELLQRAEAASPQGRMTAFPCTLAPLAACSLEFCMCLSVWLQPL